MGLSQAVYLLNQPAYYYVISRYFSMNRLLALKPQLVSQTEFDEYRRKSTIDKEEFNRVVNGPNYKERMRAFKVISENPSLFQHYHLTEASRPSQRENTTKQVFFLKKHIGL